MIEHHSMIGMNNSGSRNELFEGHIRIFSVVLVVFKEMVLAILPRTPTAKL